MSAVLQRQRSVDSLVSTFTDVPVQAVLLGADTVQSVPEDPSVDRCTLCALPSDGLLQIVQAERPHYILLLGLSRSLDTQDM